MGSPHRYIPNTDQNVADMLADIGVSSIDDLFSVIPPEFRLTEPLSLPKALSEPRAFGRAEQGRRQVCPFHAIHFIPRRRPV